MKYLILLLALTACGTAEEKREAATVKKKTPAVKAEINRKAIAAKAYINAPFVTPSPTPTAVPVDDKVVVVGDNEPTNFPTTNLAKGASYVQTPVNWADAMEKTPDGKRLATRDELFALWDEGVLKGVSFSTGAIWCANAKDSQDAWTLSTFDGSLSSSEMSNELSAVYVDKE